MVRSSGLSWGIWVVLRTILFQKGVIEVLVPDVVDVIVNELLCHDDSDKKLVTCEFPPNVSHGQSILSTQHRLRIMSENTYQNHIPNWLYYILSAVSLVGVSGAALLYFYQTELIYPSSYPEGSRRVVRVKLLHFFFAQL